LLVTVYRSRRSGPPRWIVVTVYVLAAVVLVALVSGVFLRV
jgi:hypothetical protein